MKFGQDVDFSRPFFPQFKELWQKVPVPALMSFYDTLVNSEYTNQVGHCKNCYLLFNSDYNEGCSYGSEIEKSKDCYDSLALIGSEQCYESVNCQQCFQTYYSVDCENSHNIWFGNNLTGCSDCFGCANLKNKQYHIFNQPYTREEYQKRIAEFGLGSAKSLEEIKTKARELHLKFPRKFMHGRQNGEVSGDYIYHADRVFNSFIVNEAQGLKYCQWMLAKPIKDCMDYTEYGDGAERVYESLVSGLGISDVKFGIYIFRSSMNVAYGVNCHNTQNVFGCVSLRAKQYCVLNKQYTKDEYEALVQKIIEYMKKSGEYGEFFPVALSPFAYNETTAVEQFPLTKNEAVAQGFHWRDPEIKDRVPTMQSQAIPDKIKDAPETLTKELLGCAHASSCADQCGSVFTVTGPELKFLQKNNLPLPRLCPNCRHAERLVLRTPFHLTHRRCQCAGEKSENATYTNTANHPHGSAHCPHEFETAYSADRPEIIYCESCYQAEVY